MTNPKSWLSGALVMLLLLGGCSPNKLHLQAYRGNVLSVKEILDNGEKIGKTDNRGWTALHYAMLPEVTKKPLLIYSLIKGQRLMHKEIGEKPLYMLRPFFVMKRLLLPC
jgi:hypothetical protein